MAAVVGGIRCCCYSRSRSAPIPLCWCLMPLTSTSAPNFNVDVNFASRRKSARLSQLYFGENLFGMDKNSPLLTRRYSSQHDDVCEFPSEGPISVTGGIVALGKFDALHIGHRQLAIQASKAGIPFLLSFVGMAEVLGWEARPPVVAKCDRKRVLSTWASYCGNVSPGEFHVQFSSVRQLSPREFVEKLANELKISGVVTGENYRFGYKAAGDASELVKLCEEYGMKAYIVGSVMDNKTHGSLLDSKDKGQVSSTRVRRALADGDINYVTELLGRNHRLVLVVSEEVSSESGRISVSKSCLLNLPPKEGLYDKCLCFIGDSRDGLPCTALIDSTRIHVESTIQNISFEHCQRIGIEFGAPVVAKCDRKRVLSTWASYCGNVSPGEFHVQFSIVRQLSPREFVEKLANELKISGVVTGENYRFGYKAAGDASELVKLCEEYGMKAYIVGSVMDKKAHGSLLDSKDKGQVSSTRVRRALADGDINYVTELLGRNHRLVLVVSEKGSSESGRISVSKSCLLNLPPKEGLYDKCRCFIGDSRDGLPCTALIDSTHIHVESTIQNISFEHCQRIGIEFGCEY